MKRPCVEPGCPLLTTKTRCPSHQRDYMEQRGYTSEYKQAHREARALLAPRVAAGTACSRCTFPIEPLEPWEADLRPWGWEPSHATCNRRAGQAHEP